MYAHTLSHADLLAESLQWLLKMEEALCAETISEEKAGIDLNEVYERLDEMEADKVTTSSHHLVLGIAL